MDITNPIVVAVLTALGYEDYSNEDLLVSLNDVSTHGAAGGFNGFTYYAETTAFYDTNTREIWELVESQATLTDETAGALVESFTTMVGLSVADLFLSDHERKMNVKNALAWFTLETVAYNMVCFLEGEA